MINKIISYLIIFCFFTIPISQCLAEPYTSLEETNIYGFIVPLVKSDNVTVDDKINCKIRHMINDFLREQIPVYWTTINIEVYIQKIDDENEQEMTFEKGTFIIPFTGNDAEDAKIISIICDYNQSSEIEENLETIPIYLLTEPLNTPTYKLSEVKIAQYRNIVTTGEICFLYIAEKCGFLTFEFLTPITVTDELNNADFNVLTWPGGAPEYSSFYKSSFIQTILDDVKYNVSNAIRKFVWAGGGYIGSCYGAYRASRGYKIGPIPIYFKKDAYNNPNLESIEGLSISDYLVFPPIPSVYLSNTYSKIINKTHPVTFGLDNLVTDYIWGGPKIVHVGKDAQVIAQFCDSNNPLDGTPSWMSSNFGNGKVISFNTHPEIIGFEKKDRSHIGRTVISNALFYTTSKGIEELITSQYRILSFINNIWDKTSNIDIIQTGREDIFDEIENNINQTISEINNLDKYLSSLKELIKNVSIEKNIDIEKLGYISINETTKYYLHPLIEYFENTTTILETLENIYPILKNDSNFVQKLEDFKGNLSENLYQAKKIILKSLNLSGDFEKSLLYYQNSIIFSNLKRIILMDKAHKLYQEIFQSYHFIPETYLDSLKFLRTSWYNYESFIC